MKKNIKDIIKADLANAGENSDTHSKSALQNKNIIGVMKNF